MLQYLVLLRIIRSALLHRLDGIDGLLGLKWWEAHKRSRDVGNFLTINLIGAP